jgi:hypothetical protein
MRFPSMFAMAGGPELCGAPDASRYRGDCSIGQEVKTADCADTLVITRRIG